MADLVPAASVPLDDHDRVSESQPSALVENSLAGSRKRKRKQGVPIRQIVVLRSNDHPDDIDENFRPDDELAAGFVPLDCATKGAPSGQDPPYESTASNAAEAEPEVPLERSINNNSANASTTGTGFTNNPSMALLQQQIAFLSLMRAQQQLPTPFPALSGLQQSSLLEPPVVKKRRRRQHGGVPNSNPMAHFSFLLGGDLNAAGGAPLPREYQCKHCEFRTPNKPLWLKHKVTHSRHLYRCQECDYASSHFHNMRRHEIKHLQNHRFRCPHCNYSSPRESGVKFHINQYHSQFGRSLPIDTEVGASGKKSSTFTFKSEQQSVIVPSDSLHLSSELSPDSGVQSVEPPTNTDDARGLLLSDTSLEEPLRMKINLSSLASVDGKQSVAMNEEIPCEEDGYGSELSELSDADSSPVGSPAVKESAEDDAQDESIVNADDSANTPASLLAYCSSMQSPISDSVLTNSSVPPRRSDVRPDNCAVCNKSFSSLAELRVHEATHTPPYACITCGSPYIALSQLKRHRTMMHSTNASSPSASDLLQLMERFTAANGTASARKHAVVPRSAPSAGFTSHPFVPSAAGLAHTSQSAKSSLSPATSVGPPLDQSMMLEVFKQGFMQRILNPEKVGVKKDNAAKSISLVSADLPLDLSKPSAVQEEPAYSDATTIPMDLRKHEPQVLLARRPSCGGDGDTSGSDCDESRKNGGAESPSTIPFGGDGELSDGDGVRRYYCQFCAKHYKYCSDLYVHIRRVHKMNPLSRRDGKASYLDYTAPPESESAPVNEEANDQMNAIVQQNVNEILSKSAFSPSASISKSTSLAAATVNDVSVATDLSSTAVASSPVSATPFASPLSDGLLSGREQLEHLQKQIAQLRNSQHLLKITDAPRLPTVGFPGTNAVTGDATFPVFPPLDVASMLTALKQQNDEAGPSADHLVAPPPHQPLMRTKGSRELDVKVRQRAKRAPRAAPPPDGKPRPLNRGSQPGPFKCPHSECNFSTNWRCIIERHLWTHSSTKPFSCDFCDYASRWSGDIKTHIMKYHSRQWNGDASTLEVIMARIRNRAKELLDEELRKLPTMGIDVNSLMETSRKRGDKEFDLLTSLTYTPSDGIPNGSRATDPAPLPQEEEDLPSQLLAEDVTSTLFDSVADCSMPSDLNACVVSETESTAPGSVTVSTTTASCT